MINQGSFHPEWNFLRKLPTADRRRIPTELLPKGSLNSRCKADVVCPAEHARECFLAAGAAGASGHRASNSLASSDIISAQIRIAAKGWVKFFTCWFSGSETWDDPETKHLTIPDLVSLAGNPPLPTPGAVIPYRTSKKRGSEPPAPPSQNQRGSGSA